MITTPRLTVLQLTRMLDFAANYFDTWHAVDPDIPPAGSDPDVCDIQMLLDGRRLVEQMEVKGDHWQEVAFTVSNQLDRIEWFCRYRWEQMQAPWYAPYRGEQSCGFAAECGFESDVKAARAALVKAAKGEAE